MVKPLVVYEQSDYYVTIGKLVRHYLMATTYVNAFTWLIKTQLTMVVTYVDWNTMKKCFPSMHNPSCMVCQWGVGQVWGPEYNEKRFLEDICTHPSCMVHQGLGELMFGVERLFVLPPCCCYDLLFHLLHNELMFICANLKKKKKRKKMIGGKVISLFKFTLHKVEGLNDHVNVN